MKVKFVFHLKSGKTIESISTFLKVDKFREIYNTLRTSFTEGVTGSITLEDCIVSLSDCEAVEWEVFESE